MASHHRFMLCLQKPLSKPMMTYFTDTWYNTRPVSSYNTLGALSYAHWKENKMFLVLKLSFALTVIFVFGRYVPCDIVAIDLFHKTHNAPVPYPTAHHFVTEMCTCVHISVTKCCVVGYWYNVSWDLWDGSVLVKEVMSQHWGRYETRTAILQTMFSNTSSSMKVVTFQFKFSLKHPKRPVDKKAAMI